MFDSLLAILIAIIIIISFLIETIKAFHHKKAEFIFMRQTAAFCLSICLILSILYFFILFLLKIEISFYTHILFCFTNFSGIAITLYRTICFLNNVPIEDEYFHPLTDLIFSLLFIFSQIFIYLKIDSSCLINFIFLIFTLIILLFLNIKMIKNYKK